MSGSRVVVTGGAGFIGSRLVRALVAGGRRVRVVDDLSTGRPENLPDEAELIEGDAAEVAPRAFEGAEVVFHLAAMVSVPRSMGDPRGSHRATAESTMAVLDAAQAAGVRRVVNVSSSAVYGDAPALPKKEDQPPAPLSPYAIAKYCGELYGAFWARHRGLETVSLRFFNVYGPGQRPDSPYAAAIPIFLRELRAGGPVPIHGDGRQTRDFTYVDDAVQGLLKAAQSADAPGRIYNIATGREVAVLDLAERLAEVLGLRLRVLHLPPRPGDVARSWADISAARRDLGYAPACPLEEGLRRTAAA